MCNIRIIVHIRNIIKTCLYECTHTQCILNSQISSVQLTPVYGMGHTHASLTHVPLLLHNSSLFTPHSSIPAVNATVYRTSIEVLHKSATIVCFNSTARNDSDNMPTLWQQDWKQVTAIFHLICTHMASTVQYIVLGLTMRECYATKSCRYGKGCSLKVSTECPLLSAVPLPTHLSHKTALSNPRDTGSRHNHCCISLRSNSVLHLQRNTWQCIACVSETNVSVLQFTVATNSQLL